MAFGDGRATISFVVRLNEEAPFKSPFVYKYIAVALLVAGLWGCKKAAAPTGVPGRWNVTSDDRTKFVSAPPNITQNLPIKYNPWFQFNKDGTGAFMRDTTGAGGVTNFTYELTRDSTVSYYQPIIKINVPPQVIDNVHTDGYLITMNIDQVNSQVLNVDFFTYDDEGMWDEYIGMTRVN